MTENTGSSKNPQELENDGISVNPDKAWQVLKGNSIILAGGYGQGTFKLFSFQGNDFANPQMTDNGKTTPFIRYLSQESYFAEYPLRIGKIAFGYNYSAEYATIVVNRQLVTNAFYGDDLGTEIKGDFFIFAPQVFVKMGPLYADRNIFWRFGGGIGVGFVSFDGTVYPFDALAGESSEKLSSNGYNLSFFMPFSWELQIEDWVLSFHSIYLSGRGGGESYSYELYVLDLGYTFRF
ncbi:hypothetical protein KKA14_18340 [bacterium]|nr:hypothetical protein [bacterium]